MNNDKKTKKKPKIPFAVKKNNYSDVELAQMASLPITINVLYGSAKINIYDLIKLKSGDLIALDQFFDEPLELCVNGKIIAQGELEQRDNGWGIRITAIQGKTKRLNCLLNC